MVKRNHLISNFCTLFLIKKIIDDIVLNEKISFINVSPKINEIDDFFASNIFIKVFCVILFAWGSDLPDIDQKLPFIKHRTWTHTIWFIMPSLLLSLYFYNVLEIFLPLFSISIGIFLHIFYDSFSKQGICWFIPNYQKNNIKNKKGKKIHKGIYKVNKCSENIFVFILVTVTIIFISIL